MTVAVTQDLLSRMPLVLLKKVLIAFGTVCYLNQDNPVPNSPNSYASLHAGRKCNAIRRWYKNYIYIYIFYAQIPNL